jgi:gluconolactonase
VCGAGGGTPSAGSSGLAAGGSDGPTGGTIYFTDPDWQAGGRPGPGFTGVYYLPPGGAALLIDASLDNPNGIALAPDGTALYVGDSSGTVSAYPVNPDGSTGSRSDFATVTEPDGMAVDCAGNLYVTSHAAGTIHVFAPGGAPLGQIAVATSLTNLAFGGADRRTLSATAGKALYAIQMNLPGYPY